MYTKIFHLLSKSERKTFFVLFAFILISMLLEMISIGLLIPILSFFINPDKLKSFLSLYDLELDNNFLMYGTIFIVVVFFIKNLFLSFFLWFQNFITNNIRVSLSSRLFKNYLNQNYSIFLKENFGDTVRNLRVEAMRYGSLLLQYINLINEIFVIIGLLILLFFNNKELSYIFFSIIIFSSALYLFLTNKKIKKVGEIRFSSEGKAINYILEGLNAFREIKLRGLENKIIKSFNKENQTYSSASTKGSFISELPKLWLEFLSVVIFIIFVIYLDSQLSSKEDTLILLGLLAGICFRTIPSIKKIIVSINKIKFSLPSIDALTNISNSFDNLKIKKNLDQISFSKQINLRDIKFKYENKDLVFNNLDLTINKGEKISIIGETGSGKTTLIDLIAGLIKPTSGSILIDDKDVSKEDFPNWWNKISYMPQNPFIFNDSIFNNVSLFDEPNEENKRNVEKYLEIVELKSFLKSKNIFEVLVSAGLDISGGEKQRIGIARALYSKSDVLIFDESTSALDKNTEKIIIDNIINFDKDMTIIFVTHKNYPMSKSTKIYEIVNSQVLMKNATKQ